MKHILIALVVVACLWWLMFADSGPRGEYLAFDRQREAWHRKCDVYVGQAQTTDAARACQEELEELTAYAKRQGWTR